MNNFILLVAVLSLLSVNAQGTEEKKLTVDPQTNCELRYFYFPNMEVYYDMKKEVYHYQANNTWTISTELPPYYGGYSLYKKERVVLTDYEGDSPEESIKIHREMYPYNPKGRIKRPAQPLLTDSPAVAIE